MTPAGQAYVQMPVHETNLYYRIPGQLQAERYVTMNQMNIAPTTDTNGLADMITAAAGGSLYYNIQVDTAGSYPLNFRVAGAIGQISVYEGGTLLGTANIHADQLVNGFDNRYLAGRHANTRSGPFRQRSTYSTGWNFRRSMARCPFRPV